MYDVAPVFENALTYLPLDDLREIRHNLETKGSGAVAVKKAILSISVEILRRKWGAVNE